MNNDVTSKETSCSEFQHILAINQYNDLFQSDHNLDLDQKQDLDLKSFLLRRENEHKSIG